MDYEREGTDSYSELVALGAPEDLITLPLSWLTGCEDADQPEPEDTYGNRGLRTWEL